MTEAEQAYAATEAAIRKAAESGATRLDLSRRASARWTGCRQRSAGLRG
jgi:hypothetical protein